MSHQVLLHSSAALEDIIIAQGQINFIDRMVPYVSFALLSVQFRGTEVNRAHLFGITLRNVAELICGK